MHVKHMGLLVGLPPLCCPCVHEQTCVFSIDVSFGSVPFRPSMKLPKNRVTSSLHNEEDVMILIISFATILFSSVFFFFLQVPKETRSRYATTGLGLTSRVVGTDPTFKRLDTSSARRAYG